MPRITISYRRSDSGGITWAIYQRLEDRYGKDSVFIDLEAIPPGKKFRQHIADVLKKTDVFLAIIGPKWLGETEDGTKRIDDEEDLVRIEVATAL
ncbi:MAG: toll/interleukin-1 receptor domain-containing protein, partial [Candidatus Eremiobacteraeota bacterium]|nr:toll/interleukin-1 receptor domain-containing protein [Candidatus Eremiobacteraeota bacterium]